MAVYQKGNSGKRSSYFPIDDVGKENETHLYAGRRELLRLWVSVQCTNGMCLIKAMCDYGETAVVGLVRETS